MTSDKLDHLILTNPDAYFVFGSNLSGYHGAGAARTAKVRYGAVQGVGEGITGKTYALPTVGYRISKMKTRIIETHVNRFLQFAAIHKDKGFMVTRVGCGLAGRHDSEIAPMFKGATENCFFDKVWEEYLGSTYNYWGTY